MGISVFPVPVVSTLNASAITAAAAGTLYEGRATFDAGVYQITCASGVITNFQFLSNSTTILASGVTASGVVSINLASTADRIRLWTNTGTDTVVTITRTAVALTNQFSGTLDTVSTVGTSTYTGTSTSGFGYAILVGAGGGGGGATTGSQSAGGGGGSGGICAKLVQLTGSMSVTIGTAGTGGAAGNNNGVAGGNSTFDGMTAGGGAGGTGAASGFGRPGGAGGTATGGTINSSGGAGGAGDASFGGGAGTAAVTPYSFVVSNGTTGGGGGGGWQGAGAGAGSGIGTGGNGGGGSNATAGTGYGSGGGGALGGSRNGVGAAGTQGVLYVLRF